MNAIAFLGAYSMTHFRSSEQWSLASPKPINYKRPSDFGLPYETKYIAIARQQRLETWWIPTANAPSRGTILLFPGNRGSKSQVLLPARVLHNLDYDTLLVDFRGTGGSSGNTTTLGVREGEDVAAAFQWVRQQDARRPIALYGVSMGTAAILRAISTQNIAPDAILLELPYSHLLNSVKRRLRFYNIPTFPAAELIVFWGSIQHKINGFAHNPAIYAKQVRCPTLILQGDRDKWIDRAELKQLEDNLPYSHHYISFPNAGHQLLITVNPKLWRQSVQQFLDGID
ncbi:alpha/beta hydrolase [Oscillatoria sp. FACHB-1406]|nr:alpha/beta hydrolase [Oscillatoria sp. FACHB-1406]